MARAYIIKTNLGWAVQFDSYETISYSTKELAWDTFTEDVERGEVLIRHSNGETQLLELDLNDTEYTKKAPKEYDVHFVATASDFMQITAGSEEEARSKFTEMQNVYRRKLFDD